MENYTRVISVTSDKQKLLERIHANAAKHLAPSNDRFRHFTDHSIAHSDRILDLIYTIFENQRPPIVLNEDESFIIQAAAYLHDIGMQIPIDKLLAYPELDKLLNESQLRKEEILNDDCLLTNFIRDYHHIFSSYAIRQSPQWPDFYIGYTGHDLHSGEIRKIALIAEAHRKIILSELPEREANVRVQFLAALLRLADALDCDKTRVNLQRLAELKVGSESKLHWFLHYCVEILKIEDCYLQVHAIVPPGWIETFKSVFIYNIWRQYHTLVDIFRINHLALAWAPSKVTEESLADQMLQLIDPNGQLVQYINKKAQDVWLDTPVQSLMQTLGSQEMSAHPQLDVSPYYFTALEAFDGIKLHCWPDGAFLCSYKIFEGTEPTGTSLWTSPQVRKTDGGPVILPPPPFHLKQAKKYSYKIDAYVAPDAIFDSQRGIFWLISKQRFPATSPADALDASSTGRNHLLVASSLESNELYDAALHSYIELVDTVPAEKRSIILRMVIILERIYDELHKLGWTAERDRVHLQLIYWAELIKPIP